MGRTKQKPKAHAKIKKYKRSRDTKRRDRDVDQVFDDIKRAEALGPQVIPFDDDLPGGGQFYCARPAASDAPPRARARRPRPQVETGKHFADQKGLDDHKKSRAYKRRVKELKEDTKYSQTEAEIAAGMSVEVLPKMRDVRAAAGEAAPPARPTPMEA